MTIAVRRYRVEGDVQGVGYRWFVRERARALDLAGLVRNEPDGAVVVIATGHAPALDQLEAHLRAGPPSSRVSDVVRRELTRFEAVGLPHPFAIDR